MEQYRKKLKIQTICSAVGILLLAALLLFVYVYMPRAGRVLADKRLATWPNFWNSFLGGVTAGSAGLLLVNIFLNLRAMKNPAALKKQYIKEHDERKNQIWLQSGANAYWFVALGLLLAAIVAGYFSPMAFACILGSLLYTCLVRIVLKIYYSKKY